ncbi:uncharacterized protein [Rutidosis leptorrhynchoides]|uniref:uncharacterized protein n=1 Tax=Rutidosis leptorrhynchoides TaxID=125765 RepID=UPI003A9A40F2
MEPKFATILCYWGGGICNGEEGVSYNIPPTKAIKVQFGIQFQQLIEKLHSATSIDKQKYRINIVCRYPSVVGKFMRYVALPIKDDDDVEIMFDALDLHPELSNIDLYLEVDDVIGSKRFTEVPFRNQDTFSIENEASWLNLRSVNAASNVIENASNTISQTDHVNNASSSEFNTGDVIEVEKNQALYVNEDEVVNDVQVPSSFTRLQKENIDMATADSENVSRFKKENELTKELGKKSFKDKKELIRAIKLYSIKNRIQYEVVETCPTI